MSIRILLFTFAVVMQSQPVFAQPKKYPAEDAIEKYFQAKTKAIADRCLTDLTTKAEWEKRKPVLREQFFEMMGLWPLPKKTPLNAKVVGEVKGDGFVVEKLVFESMPNLFVTAHVYRPAVVTGPLPTILYVCGHGNVVIDGISYGSKVSYQYHPAWFATHGYVCIILDTLQLGEIPGEHHGTYKLKQWWWPSYLYSPGGIELWNAIRALDYLETRPDVDVKKIGVTGRSGGGATSWWIMAADDRPVCAAPVAGITDLYAYVCEGQTSDHLKKGTIAGHCDCMFVVNKYQWDFPMIAALAAPRPLLLGNSDEDSIFPVEGYRRLAKKVAKVYDLYGHADRFTLLETKGPHKDTPELRVGINRFMNKHLKGDTTTEVKDDLPEKLDPKELKVLEKRPPYSINNVMPAAFISHAKFDVMNLPDETQRKAMVEKLRETSFRSWPKSPAAPRLVEAIKEDGMEMWRLESEPNITIEVKLRKASKPAQAIRMIVDRESTLQTNVSADDKHVVHVSVRGVKRNRWAEAGSTVETHIRRRFPLIGETLESGQIFDIRQAIAWLQSKPVYANLPIEIEGEHEAAGLAMYAGLMVPAIKCLTLTEPPLAIADPTSPALLGIGHVMNHWHALTILASDRPVEIRTKTPMLWDTMKRVKEAGGALNLTIKSAE